MCTELGKVQSRRVSRSVGTDKGNQYQYWVQYNPNHTKEVRDYNTDNKLVKFMVIIF